MDEDKQADDAALARLKAEVQRTATLLHDAIRATPSAIFDDKQMAYLLTGVHDAQVEYIRALEADLARVRAELARAQRPY